MFPGGLTLPRLKSLFSKDLQPALECGPRKPLLWYAPFSPLTEQSSKLPFVFTFGCFHRMGSAGLTNQPTNHTIVNDSSLRVPHIEIVPIVPLKKPTTWLFDFKNWNKNAHIRNFPHLVRPEDNTS